MEFIINFILDLMKYLQIILGASDIFMGMTMLAASNTFVDMFVNGALAAQGFEIMAISGLFGGQMFNFLFGFSLSCLRKFFGSSQYKTFNLYETKSLFSSADKAGSITFIVLCWALLVLGVFLVILLKAK